MQSSYPPISWKDQILIAEDNSTNLKVIKGFLRSQGTLEIAGNGEEVLKAVIPDIDLKDEALKKVIKEIQNKIDNHYTALEERFSKKYDPESAKEHVINEILLDINQTLSINCKINATQYNKFKVILMDDQMPELRGSVATILIRIYEKQQGLPQSERNHIVTCSDTFKDSANKLMRSPGADTFTPKPYQKSVLLNTVKSASAKWEKEYDEFNEHTNVNSTSDTSISYKSAQHQLFSLKLTADNEKTSPKKDQTSSTDIVSPRKSPK